MDAEQFERIEKSLNYQTEILSSIKKNTSTIATIMSVAVILSILGVLLSMCSGLYY